MNSMFFESAFNKDISKWAININNDINSGVFNHCIIPENFRFNNFKIIYDLEVIKNECVICWEEDIDCYVLPCFHTHVVCVDCINHIHLCPFCRVNIS